MPSNNQQLLTAIGNLSQTIQDLDQHLNNPSGATVSTAAQAGASGGPSSATVIGAMGGPASATNAAQIAQAAQQALAAQALQNQVNSQSGASASTPPGGTTVSPTSGQTAAGAGPSSGPASQPTQNEDSLEALTWQELGGLGGPLGRFRARNYATQQYAKAGSGILQSVSNQLGGNDPNNPFQTAANWMNPNYRNANGESVGLGPGGVMAGTGLQTAYLIGSGYAQTGRDLGYGSSQANSGLFGYANPARILSGEGGQGLSLATEKQTLMGRNPFYSGASAGSGMTAANAESTVNTLAGMGFSNQNGVSGDNLNIAENLVKPMVNEGVSVQGSADWTEALRNSNTSISQLMNSFGDLSESAKALKETTDQVNSGLLQFAETQISMGGTAANAATTGQAFTATTGMSPGVLGQIQQNPMYQGIMMAQNGVLPSGITDLTPGAQMQGVMSLMQLLGGVGGSTLGGAFGGLDKNKTMKTPFGNVTMAYGSQLEVSQIAQTMGISQSDAMRLMRQAPNEKQVTGVENYMGSSTAQGLNGQTGTGLWQLLQAGGANRWSGLSSGEQQKATGYWNKYIQPGINTPGHLGLTSDQLKQLDTGSMRTNIRQRTNQLNKDLLGNQQNNTNNTVKVEISLKGKAASLLSAKSNRSLINLGANSGMTGLPNNINNTPFGDALAANNPFNAGGGSNPLSSSGPNPFTSGG